MTQTIGSVPLMAVLNKLLESRAEDGFVGRGAELFLLETLFGESAPLVIHIQGLAGVGKSALLDAFSGGLGGVGLYG
jgi:putative protein kinase ArgK-like GTPase of G3E family